MYNKPNNVSGNKLLCTFSKESDIDTLIENIQTQYTLLYNKIFILEIKDSDEYVCTYNIEYNNSKLPQNTILVHRKKETNTLYTINALNELIKTLNNGIVNISYKVEWMHYKNTILLTQKNEIKQLKTKIHQIIEL